MEIIKKQSSIKYTHGAIVERKWDYENNNELGYYPLNYTFGSTKKVWWKCDNGENHSYLREIYYAIKSNTCPECKQLGYTVSFPQKLIYYITSKSFNHVELERKVGKYSIDVFIHDINLAIEYDGSRWHKEDNVIERDKNKEKYLKDNLNCSIIRIREEGCSHIETLGESFEYNYTEGLRNEFKDLIEILNNVLDGYGIRGCKGNIDFKDVIHFYGIKTGMSKEDNIKLYKLYSRNNKFSFASLSKGLDLVVRWECSECANIWEESFKKVYRRKEENYCLNCIKIKKENIKKEYNGFLDMKNVNKDISKDELYSLLSKEPNFNEVAKLFGISGNSLRKRCKKLGIPHQSSYYIKKFEDEKGYSYVTYRNYIEFKNNCEDFNKILELIENETKNKIVTTNKIMSENLYKLIIKIYGLQPPLSLNQYDVVYKDDPRYEDLIRFYEDIGKSRGKSSF